MSRYLYAQIRSLSFLPPLPLPEWLYDCIGIFLPLPPMLYNSEIPPAFHVELVYITLVPITFQLGSKLYL